MNAASFRTSRNIGLACGPTRVEITLPIREKTHIRPDIDLVPWAQLNGNISPAWGRHSWKRLPATGIGIIW